MNIDDLKRILITCAGSCKELEDGRDVLDTTFEDLGYDSLALMESGSFIKKEYGVAIPDDDIVDVTTPREMLDLVNSLAPVVG
jgi:act minimal PKS acyl carrier protein